MKVQHARGNVRIGPQNIRRIDGKWRRALVQSRQIIKHGNTLSCPRHNRNIEDELLRAFLKDVQGYSDTFIAQARHELNKVAGDQSKGLYDANRAVYDLLLMNAGRSVEVELAFADIGTSSIVPSWL